MSDGSLSPESEEENLSQYLDDLSTSPRFVNIDYSGTQLGPHNVHLITTGVHLGNAYAAKDKQFLVQNGFTHVLNAAEGKHPWCQVNTNQDYYIDTKITYFGIPAYDSFTWDMSVHFDEAALFIDDVVRNGGKVLVHCRAGVSRSATLVVAYLMIWKGMTSREALAYTLERRNIRPNWGFLKQLAKLDSRLKKERASSICKGDDSANLKSLSTPCPSNSDMQ